MQLFKVEAYGDTIYVRTFDHEDVEEVLGRHFGYLPGTFYDSTPISDSDLPAGEEVYE